MASVQLPGHGFALTGRRLRRADPVPCDLQEAQFSGTVVGTGFFRLSASLPPLCTDGQLAPTGTHPTSAYGRASLSRLLFAIS
jgi:hypothetical protein